MNPLKFVASQGPQMDDETTYEFCRQVLCRFAAGLPVNTVIPEALCQNPVQAWIARQHLGPVFRYVLAGNVVPGVCLNAWAAQQREALVRHERALSAAVDLQSVLREADVPIAFMRGLVLANRVYSRPDLRPMTDVDVLVAPHDRQRLANALREHGFEPSKRLRSQLVYCYLGTTFEFHWRLLTPKRYRNLIDEARLLAETRQLDTTAGTLPCLRAEHELFAVVIHAYAHHDLTAARALLDIALLTRQEVIDWTRLTELARMLRLDRVLALGLAFAADYLDLPDLLPSDLPTIAPELLAAYRRQLHGVYSRSDHCRRLVGRFATTRTVGGWIRQAVRLVSVDELHEFIAPGSRAGSKAP